MVATAALVEPGEPVTIGGPIPNYTCYVVDEALNLLDRGQEGELLIGGPGVAAGYLKRDELTREKFIANPFRAEGHDRVLYRSGDAVVLDPIGNIQFRGRIDDQVKLRGFRIELGEIEAKLVEHPGVKQAAVVLRQDDGLDQLVGFVVAQGPAAIDPLVLRAALRDTLPPYMVPSRFEAVETLPRLPSGKVDRNRLKKVALTARTAEAQEEPRTATEASLLAAAKAVLPSQSMPLDADFFTDLGGHSLLAARFVSVVRQDPALSGITLQDMYRARSLRAISAVLDQRKPLIPSEAVDLRFTAPPLRRRFFCGLAQAAGFAADPLALHCPVARCLRQLHAVVGERREPFRGSRLARRHLYGDQYPDHSVRHRVEMGDLGSHEAGAIPALGRVLLSLVAGAAHHGPDPSQVVSGFARHAPLHDRHGGQGRHGRHHRRP